MGRGRGSDVRNVRSFAAMSTQMASVAAKLPVPESPGWPADGPEFNGANVTTFYADFARKAT